MLLETDISVGICTIDLSAFPITVPPPLRERREDIAFLADHFLKKYAAAAGRSIRAISADALQMLTQYDFPRQRARTGKRH